MKPAAPIQEWDTSGDPRDGSLTAQDLFGADGAALSLTLDCPVEERRERRSSMRLPLEIDVDLDGAAHQVRASTMDLSAGGMFIATTAPIPIGSEVVLAFELPGAVELHVLGLVCWRRTHHEGSYQPGLGIQFFCLEPEAKAKLERFCDVRVPLYSFVSNDTEAEEEPLYDASGEYPCAHRAYEDDDFTD